MVDDPAMLARHTWILVANYKDAFERWYAALGLSCPKPARVLTVNNGLMAYDAAKSGAGIMISGGAPNWPDKYVQDCSLVLAHPFHAYLGTFGYYIAVRPERMEDAAIRAFLDWFARLGARG
jgi:DNA-binding transcriptional LysR family regulator